MKANIFVFFCALRLVSVAFCQSAPPVQISDAGLSATDALGRSLPSYAEVGPPKSNRWVGMFYWFWHGDDRFGKDYNVTEFLKSHPGFRDFTAKPNNPTFYWGEPVFGYYRSTDPWVMRKHLALLAHAGVDFLFLDYTNAILYDDELATYLKVAEDLKSHGAALPKLVFFLNANPDPMVESLYTKWYKPGKYANMWFNWEGKPLIMSPAPTKGFKDPMLLPEVQNYFTFRPTWALFDTKQDAYKWRFMDTLQQDDVPRSALGPDGQPEQIVVNKSMGGPLWDNMQSGGVSTYPGFEPTYNDQWLSGHEGEGLFFQHSWDQALAHPAPILLVTGWNEWKASVWESPGVVMLGRKTVAGQGYIVDEFNMDFNRDVEPMRGGYFDNYYWQFISNMRRYKGMLPPQKVSAPKTISLSGRLSQWDDVSPVYRDPKGSATKRDWPGTIPGTHYADASGRNVILSAQVARDKGRVYFHARTVDPLTQPSGPGWMLLFIKTSGHGWNGYDLLIGRDRIYDQCSIEENVGGKWTWKLVGHATFTYTGNDLVVAVPRRILGAGHGPLNFSFKWADNLPDQPSLYDFYTTGDVTPEARFNFDYKSN